MKKLCSGLWVVAGVVILLVVFWGAPAYSQEINLDKMERCGDLLCYPSLKEADVFYYLPDRPRLAMKNGRPQFSFLKYARVQETGEAGTGRAEGGGIVHFLVTYGANESRVRAAEGVLQQTHENGRIAGPIVYRTGNFALVTSFTEGAETLTRTVAVGKAPLMEGQKAAVSIALTREGAELLWESFQSSTPDISIVFDMEFAGVREPYEAILEADWKRISQHHRVQVGGQYKWFGIDIDLLFQELRQTGAIKITTKGEHAVMDRIIESANTKLLNVMFDAAPDELTRMAQQKGNYDNLNQAVKMLKDRSAPAEKKTTKPTEKKKTTVPKKKSELILPPGPDNRVNPILFVLSRLAPGVSIVHAADQQAADEAFQKANEFYQKKNYQKALEWLNKSIQLDDRLDDEQRGKSIFAVGQCLRHLGRCNEAIPKYREAYNLWKTDEGRGFICFYLGHCLEATAESEEALAAFLSALPLLGENSEKGKETLRRIEVLSSEIYNKARRLDEEARSSGYESGKSKEAVSAYQSYLEYVKPSVQRTNEVGGRIRFLTSQIEKETGETVAAAASPTEQAAAQVESGAEEGSDSADKTETKKELKEQVAKAVTDKLVKSLEAPDADKKAVSEKKPDDKKKTEDKTSRKKDTAGFSLVASYQMKHIKRSGKMVYHMNHYRTETQAFAMTENIGDLYRRYGNDPRIFRAVNIDDPVFKQREIHVTLDGQDSKTFKKHMNFVTVQMKKRHQSGELTTDEVIITPERFNQSGNAFILLYGWKGDNDRESWLNYTIETLWSFHGGMEMRIPPITYDSAMVAIQPPHRYRTVTVEGEGEELNAAGVRHAVITFTSYVAGEPVTTEATIRNRGPASSMMLDIPEDRDAPPTSVSITWYLQGGKVVTTHPRKLEGNLIYWDELPDTGV